VVLALQGRHGVKAATEVTAAMVDALEAEWAELHHTGPVEL
jgi:hypothetical protein